MLRLPAFPDARCAVAWAMSKLIAVSRRGSSLSCSTLKNNQGLSSEIVVGRSNSFAYTPFSLAQLRNLIAAKWASSITRSFLSSSRHWASSSRRSENVGIGLDGRIAARL